MSAPPPGRAQLAVAAAVWATVLAAAARAAASASIDYPAAGVLLAAVVYMQVRPLYGPARLFGSTAGGGVWSHGPVFIAEDHLLVLAAALLPASVTGVTFGTAFLAVSLWVARGQAGAPPRTTILASSAATAAAAAVADVAFYAVGRPGGLGALVAASFAAVVVNLGITLVWATRLAVPPGEPWWPTVRAEASHQARQVAPLAPLFATLGYTLVVAWQESPLTGVVGVVLITATMELLRSWAHAALTAQRWAAERAELLDKVMAAEEEHRRSLAGDLHDGPLQTLLAVKMLLDLDPSAEDLGEVRKTVEVAARELRRQLNGLLPQDVTGVGFVAASRRIVAALHNPDRPPGVDLDVVGEVDAALTPAASNAAYWVVDGALRNALRHAAARHVTVSTRVGVDTVEVRVADDGVGMTADRPDEALRTGHVGLASMRVRVERAGGRFAIVSAPAAGTTVIARFPRADRAATAS